MSDDSAVTRSHTPLVMVAVIILASLGGVFVVSPAALLAVFVHGVSAMLVLVPPVLFGVGLVRVLPLGALPQRWHLLLGAALGLGFTSLLILGLGLVGVLHRPVWLALMIVLAGAGVALLRRPKDRPANEHDSAFPYALLWLPSAAFGVLALLAAANPPGLVWSEEGFGYDVLEYHLQLPKEYRRDGRISYLPHNVYANFPANVEMLYLLAMIVHDDDVDVGVTANMIHLALAALTVFAAWVAGRERSPRAGIVCGVTAATCGWLAYLSGLAYVENGMLFFGMTSLAMILRMMNGTGMAAGRERRIWLLTAGVMAGFACGCKYTALPMIALPLAVATALAPAASRRVRLARVGLFTIAALLSFSPWLVKNQIMTGNPVFPLANDLFEASPPGWGAEETARWNAGHRPPMEERSIGAKFAALWRHVPGDHYQRFGPAILLLALGGLWGRRRDRNDTALTLILLVQLCIWLFATHLYSRFAVVLLLPLALLAGRSLPTGATKTRSAIVAVVLLLGAAWNFVFAAKPHAAESVAGVPASVIYEGQVPGYDYFDAVNRQLPQDARVLLVGEARGFYFQRDIDYTVVFNHNPFVAAIRGSKSAEDIVAWLGGHGYTHVLVNWSEIRRLARTYGFAREVTPELFRRLEGAGLSLPGEHEFTLDGKPHVSIYDVRP